MMMHCRCVNYELRSSQLMQPSRVTDASLSVRFSSTSENSTNFAPTCPRVAALGQALELVVLAVVVVE